MAGSGQIIEDKTAIMQVPLYSSARQNIIMAWRDASVKQTSV